ncbi:DUF424 domain-containing protein [Stetteria hydrogenophila]
MGLYYVKYYRIPGGLMAAIADEEVLGRLVYDRETGLSIIVSEEFYKGDLVGEEAAERALLEADVLVLAGDRIIEKAIKLGLVDPESVLRKGGLSHVQVFKFGF